jgi:hypothetical protein
LGTIIYNTIEAGRIPSFLIAIVCHIAVIRGTEISRRDAVSGRAAMDCIKRPCRRTERSYLGHLKGSKIYGELTLTLPLHRRFSW